MAHSPLLPRDRPPKVFVVSTSVDVSTDEVVKRLDQRGASVVRFNTEEFPFNIELAIKFSEQIGCDVELDDVSATSATSVWYRRVRAPLQPVEMNSGVFDFCVRESRSTLLGATMSLSSKFMSWPPATWAAEHKVYQLECARRVGLPIPRTLFTNSPRRIREAFHRFHSGMIIKPAKSGYVDYGTEQRAVFTNRLLAEHLDRVEAASLCPAIYQEYLAKACDVRVTVVGDTFFVAEIDSQTDEAAVVDWRHTTNPDLPHRRGKLPAEIESGLRRLLKALDLRFGAIDLVKMPDGRWLFLEVNPNGQWLWLEDKLGFSISDEIATWLMTT